MISSPLRALVAQRLSELDMSQAELARRAGLNAQFINDLLKGKKNKIRPEFAFQLSLALEVSPLGILRDLGLLSDQSETHDFSDTDHLSGTHGPALSIIGKSGIQVETSQGDVPIVGGPFRFKGGKVISRLRKRLPDHFRLPEWIAKEANAYFIPYNQLANQNSSLLAPGELLLVSSKRPISRLRRFVGYVAGERGAASPWVFTYVGRTGNSYELNLASGTVRLPITSVVLAHAIVAVLDPQIVP